MHDAFLLVERYNWPFSEIESLSWSDFQAFVEGATSMYESGRGGG
jgi:hypothetical protein